MGMSARLEAKKHRILIAHAIGDGFPKNVQRDDRRS
jgi:hypothetical protein